MTSVEWSAKGGKLVAGLFILTDIIPQCSECQQRLMWSEVMVGYATADDLATAQPYKFLQAKCYRCNIRYTTSADELEEETDNTP